jgi:hypothetical protein
MDRDFNFLNIKGVEIDKRHNTGNDNDGWVSTVYQENASPQKFEVSSAYFYNEIYDRFIWVEGTFDCGIGYFDDIKPVKGKSGSRFSITWNDPDLMSVSVANIQVSGIGHCVTSEVNVNS